MSLSIVYDNGDNEVSMMRLIVRNRSVNGKATSTNGNKKGK